MSRSNFTKWQNPPKWRAVTTTRQKQRRNRGEGEKGEGGYSHPPTKTCLSVSLFLTAPRYFSAAPAREGQTKGAPVQPQR